MALPVGDPRRPLQLAIRSSRLLGIIFTLLGSLVLVAMIGSLATGGTLHMPSFAVMFAGMIYLIPGILYIMFSVFLKRRQPWAIVATMTMSGLHGLLAIIACAFALMSANIVAIIVCALWAAAMGQLLWHLSKSFESIRADAEFAPRGFEPLAPNTFQQPLPPLPREDA